MENKMKKVQLLKCIKKTCQHVFTSPEFKEKQDKNSYLINMLCPKCEGDTYYVLDQNGLRSYDQGLKIDPQHITPSSRLGERQATKVWAARSRALIRASKNGPAKMAQQEQGE